MSQLHAFKILFFFIISFLLGNQICAQDNLAANEKSICAENPDRWVNIWWDEKDELIAVQWKGLNEEDRKLRLTKADQTVIQEAVLYTGSTIAYFDTQTLYAGEYWLNMEIAGILYTKKIDIRK
jgi:hypothetical protein